MDKHNGPERRKQPRLNANFIVSYRATEPRSDFDLSQTKDISQGGLFITTSRKFDKGAHLAMLIRLPFFSERVELIGRVVESQGRASFYETHVVFKDSDEEFIKKLRDFIEKQLEERREGS